MTGAVDVGGNVEAMSGSFDGVAIRRSAGGAESFDTEAATLANEGFGRSGDTWAVAMMDGDGGYKANPESAVGRKARRYETGTTKAAVDQVRDEAATF